MRQVAFIPSSMMAALLAALFFHTPSFASVSEPQQQRALYNKAKQHIVAGRHKQFKQAQRQLRDYPLYPYLYYIELSTRLSGADNKEIRKFLTDYKSLAVADRLQRRWMNRLAKKGFWQSYLKFYDDSLANTEQRCHYLQALHKTGESKKALAATADLWVVAKSQPKACDPLFKRWRKAGMLQEKHKWRRLHMAIDKGQVSLAKYIATLFPANSASARRAQKFLKVHSNPQLVNKRHLFNSKSTQDADILVYGIRRIGRRDTDKAIQLLQQYKNFSSMDQQRVLPAHKTIAFHVLSKPSDTGWRWLQQLLIDGVNEDIAVYAARLALVYEDWTVLSRAIERMPASMQQQNRWQYWQTRATLIQANITDPLVIKTKLQALAEQRDYYGFLAAELSGLPYRLNDKQSQPSDKQLQNVQNHPGIRVALELYASGATLDAYREWHRALRRLKKEDLIAAAHLAQQWGWHNAAINATISGAHWNELALRFPMAYAEAMRRGSLSANIPLSWAWAIARQESALRADARSHAGAQGLMQLMPGTARATISRQSLGIRKPTLSNIEENSRIATAHLGEMLRRFDNNRVLASAAYNAGPHRVDQWLARNTKAQAIDVWIDSTPFKETRNYMQNILMFSAIYDYRQQQDLLFLHPHERTVTP